MRGQIRDVDLRRSALAHLLHGIGGFQSRWRASDIPRRRMTGSAARVRECGACIEPNTLRAIESVLLDTSAFQNSMFYALRSVACNTRT